MTGIDRPAGLVRTAFRTSRLLDFASEKELTAQIGHSLNDWPLVVVKELVDNALDACEEAGIGPEIIVYVDERGITVGDNGPGLPAEVVVEGGLHFNVRVSSREAYVAPASHRQAPSASRGTILPMHMAGTLCNAWSLDAVVPKDSTAARTIFCGGLPSRSHVLGT